MSDTSNICPVCDGFMFAHEKMCKECTAQKTIIEERRKQRKRDEHFGPLWPTTK